MGPSYAVSAASVAGARARGGHPPHPACPPHGAPPPVSPPTAHTPAAGTSPGGTPPTFRCCHRGPHAHPLPPPIRPPSRCLPRFFHRDSSPTGGGRSTPPAARSAAQARRAQGLHSLGRCPHGGASPRAVSPHGACALAGGNPPPPPLSPTHDPRHDSAGRWPPSWATSAAARQYQPRRGCLCQRQPLGRAAGAQRGPPLRRRQGHRWGGAGMPSWAGCGAGGRRCGLMMARGP